MTSEPSGKRNSDSNLGLERRSDTVRNPTFDERRTLEEQLADFPEPQRSLNFKHLVVAELIHRQRRGETVTPDDYLQRFPQYADFIRDELPALAESARRMFTPTVTMETPDSPGLEPAAPQPALQPLPQVLGRYQLLSVLGQGGYGQVWKAYDPELDRTVAIKVPRIDRDLSAAHVEQFLSEGRKVAKLSHRGVVRVYDVGYAASRCFVVSEFVDGGTLADLLAQGPLPHRQIAQLVSDVAETLHKAHLQNIVHRDIKPANILLDRQQHPFVTDFGLAVSEEEQLIEPASMLGTYAYMSPEQAEGKSHRADARCDIYSLGVVLYQMLTRRLPFIAKSPADYRDQILHREPRPPRTIDDSIPLELERICLKCLSKSITDRYTTAADLSQALKRWLESENRKPRPETSARLMPWAMWMAATGSLLAGVVMVYQSVFGRVPIATDSSTHTVRVVERVQEPAPVVNVPVNEPENKDPLGWRVRLGADPLELFWPAYQGTGALGFRQELQCFEMNSDKVRLVKLGELPAGAHAKVAISMRQPQWIGGAGLFFGYREGLFQGKPCARFQLLSLTKLFDADRRLIFTIGRAVVIIYPATGGLMAESELGTHTVQIPPDGKPGRLALEFQNNALTGARWGNEDLLELAAPGNNSRSKPDDYTGPWGLFNFSGTTWFQHPDLQIVESRE